MDDLKNAVKESQKAFNQIKQVLDLQKEKYEDDDELEVMLAKLTGSLSQIQISTKKLYAEQRGRKALNELDENLEQDILDD